MCAQHAPNNPWPSLTAALYRGDAVNTLSVSVRAAERENKRLPEAEHRRGERIRSHRRLASCSRPPQFPVQFPVSHNGGRRQPSPCRKYLLNTDNTTLSHFTSSWSHSFFFTIWYQHEVLYECTSTNTEHYGNCFSLHCLQVFRGKIAHTLETQTGPFVSLFFF